MIKFSTTRNAKLIASKVKKGTLKKVYKGIYLEPRDSVHTFIELILEKLGITGIITYSSALEFPNITSNAIFIEGSVNKKIIFNEDDFIIHILQKNNKFTYQKAMLTATSINDIFKPTLEIGCLIQFIDSSVYDKRSNKDLACELVIEKILKIYSGEISHAGDYFRTMSITAKEYDLLDAFEHFKKYFNEYYRKAHMEGDTKRIRMFLALKEELLSTPPIEFEEVKKEPLYFYEAYFTNYIEGTEFEVEEAEKIIYDSKHRYTRHKDGNDIKKTYDIIKQISNSQILFSNYSEFEAALKATHRQMMNHRTEIIVGDFKKRSNRSGALRFVLPEQVVSTLKKGFEIYQNLTEPFHKAIFIMVLISEVHPFEDGNGRIARIFMNNELSKGRQLRILIPTVFRDDYITSLKGFSHQENPQPIIKSLIKAYKITYQINWNKMPNEIKEFIRDNSGFEKDSNSIWGINPTTLQKKSSEENEEQKDLPFSLF